MGKMMKMMQGGGSTNDKMMKGRGGIPDIR